MSTSVAKRFQKFLESGLFKDRQLVQIEIGLKQGVDVSRYADPAFRATQQVYSECNCTHPG